MEYDFLAFPNETFDSGAVVKYSSKGHFLYVPGKTFALKEGLDHRVTTLADNLSNVFFNGQLSKNYGCGVVIYVIPKFPLEFFALETGMIPDYFRVRDKDIDDLLSLTKELHYVSRITHYLTDANDYCYAYEDEILNSGLTESIGFSSVFNDCPAMIEKGDVAIEHLSKKIHKKFIFS